MTSSVSKILPDSRYWSVSYRVYPISGPNIAAYPLLVHLYPFMGYSCTRL